MVNKDYQRGLVWAKSQKQLLIDSLLTGIDIPKIYFRDVSDGDPDWEIVDGQQRLDTIFAFMDDKFSLPEDSDPVDAYETAGKKYSELDKNLRAEFDAVNLSITRLQDYSDYDVEDMFLRLQNGSPLNAAEKRHARSSNISKAVKAMSKNKAFSYCSFKNTRYAYEDIVAKILHLRVAGKITDIRAASILKTYDNHSALRERDTEPQEVKRAFNYLSKAFATQNQNPGLQKFAIVSLTNLIADMQSEFAMKGHESEVAEGYMEFEEDRRLNNQKDENDQDPDLRAYSEAARNDSADSLEYRHNLLRRYILDKVPSLALLDPNRDFTSDQRWLIYRRDSGICQDCNKQCEEDDFHADHITPHSKGGATSVENGQVLCMPCNLAKGAS